ncbi:MAG: hypothetical protein FK734_06085 [Asgard group archaeon]|nr:hypothetical protein [Asgard group archaeon]
MIFKNYALVEIGREKGASALKVVGFSEELMKKLLIEALPLGDPENEVFKLVTVDKNLYLSSLLLVEDQDSGVALIIQIDDKALKLNPLGFLDSINDLLQPIISNPATVLPDEIVLEYKESPVTEAVYENLDNFIFSILTRQKTLVVGEKIQLKEFLTMFYSYIPNELKKHITLIGNTSNVTNRVALTGLVLNDYVLKIIDSNKGEYTILFLPAKTAYGLYTSPFCKKIAKLYEEHNREVIIDEIKKFFEMAISSNDIIPVADFAAKNNLAVADASLIQWMRANYYDLPIERNILEQLE